MPGRSSVVAALLLATSAVAISTTEYPRALKRDEKRAFRAPAHRYTPSKAIKRDAGSAKAHFNGGGWILPVTLGGQQVALNIDTGSSDLWTTSTLMPTSQQDTVTSGYNFDPSSASGLEYMNGSRFGIGYADGSGASGLVGIDSVIVGGALVPSMPFGICNRLEYGDGQGSRDTNGPVGLGFGVWNSIRPDPQCTFMECLEPYVPEPVFGCKFRDDDTGFVDFGASDSSQYTGDVTNIQIDNSTGQWLTHQVQYGSNGKIFDADPITMNFDTGTSTLNLPSDAISAYFALVSGAEEGSGGSYTFPCANTLPDLDFIFGNVNSGPSKVTIPGASLKYGNATRGTCSTYIGEAGDTGNAGIPFYLSEYMIFNQSVPELSFAKQTTGQPNYPTEPNIQSGLSSVQAALALVVEGTFAFFGP